MRKRYSEVLKRLIILITTLFIKVYIFYGYKCFLNLLVINLLKPINIKSPTPLRRAYKLLSYNYNILCDGLLWVIFPYDFNS